MKSSEKVEEKQKPLESSSEAIGKKKNYWVGLYWPLLINISMCSHNYFFPCLFPLLLYSPFTHTCRSPRQIKAETRDACGCFTSKAHRHVKAPLHFLLFFLSSNATWQMIEHDNFSEGIVSQQQGHDYPTTVQTKEATKRPFGLERRSMEASRVYSNNILTECVASLHLFSN